MGQGDGQQWGDAHQREAGRLGQDASRDADPMAGGQGSRDDFDGYDMFDVPLGDLMRDSVQLRASLEDNRYGDLDSRQTVAGVRYEYASEAWVSSVGLRALREVPGELSSVAVVLLSHLSLLFVPAGVGVMLHVARIRAEWLPLLAGLLVSTALTIAVTALVFFWVMRKMGLQEAEQSP